MRTLFGLTKNKKKPKNKNASEKRRVRRRKEVQPIGVVDKKYRRLQKKNQSENAFVERMARIWGYDIGVDLGTTSVLIYVKGRGIVLHEPTYVARYVATKEVIAVGEEARAMNGRVPDDIEVIRPIRDGVIADYDTAEYLLRYLLTTVLRKSFLFKPRVLICVPSGASSVEKRAVLEASLQAGARKTVLVEEPLAAALGVELDQAESSVAMIVDIGGGTTDIAVICPTGVVVSQSLRVGGEQFDEALINYCRRRKQLIIGRHTAEEVKKQIGTVDRLASEREAMVSGRDLVTGLPKTIIMSSKDMQRAYAGTAQLIIEGVKTILEKTPPEMIADIVDHGIILTGGGSLMNGFDHVLTRSVGICSYLADGALYSVVLGTGRALQEMEKFKDNLEELQ